MLDVCDPWDEDTYMRPPVDIRYEEPLWLTLKLSVEPVDTIEDMDTTEDMEVGKHLSLIIHNVYWLTSYTFLIFSYPIAIPFFRRRSFFNIPTYYDRCW